ncbi:unnamed protein product [Allacma fusca]|uniref:Uncharacterized protein n=1 Tax=Allacma fusca TaxID=39272 RepID=A0A8J2LT58_9HEXA|nr:unnamed protein product [Allacma fusca]
MDNNKPNNWPLPPGYGQNQNRYFPPELPTVYVDFSGCPPQNSFLPVDFPPPSPGQVVVIPRPRPEYPPMRPKESYVPYSAPHYPLNAGVQVDYEGYDPSLGYRLDRRFDQQNFDRRLLFNAGPGTGINRSNACPPHGDPNFPHSSSFQSSAFYQPPTFGHGWKQPPPERELLLMPYGGGAMPSNNGYISADQARYAAQAFPEPEAQNVQLLQPPSGSDEVDFPDTKKENRKAAVGKRGKLPKPQKSKPVLKKPRLNLIESQVIHQEKTVVKTAVVNQQVFTRQSTRKAAALANMRLFATFNSPKKVGEIIDEKATEPEIPEETLEAAAMEPKVLEETLEAVAVEQEVSEETLEAAVVDPKAPDETLEATAVERKMPEIVVVPMEQDLGEAVVKPKIPEETHEATTVERKMPEIVVEPMEEDLGESPVSDSTNNPEKKKRQVRKGSKGSTHSKRRKSSRTKSSSRPQKGRNSSKIAKADTKWSSESDVEQGDRKDGGQIEHSGVSATLTERDVPTEDGTRESPVCEKPPSQNTDKFKDHEQAHSALNVSPEVLKKGRRQISSGFPCIKLTRITSSKSNSSETKSGSEMDVSSVECSPAKPKVLVEISVDNNDEKNEARGKSSENETVSYCMNEPSSEQKTDPNFDIPDLMNFEDLFRTGDHERSVTPCVYWPDSPDEFNWQSDNALQSPFEQPPVDNHSLTFGNQGVDSVALVETIVTPVQCNSEDTSTIEKRCMDSNIRRMKAVAENARRYRALPDMPILS